MNTKIKLVWICHFENQEIREKLPLSDMKVKKLLKFVSGKNGKQENIDFAPWITNLAIEFGTFDDIELHIISPYYGLKGFTYNFEMKGVYYHFFNPGFSSIVNNTLPNKFNRIKKLLFLPNRYFVNRAVRKIKPDLINLIGTENPYYSITALDIKDIPVFVSAQTVYTNPERKKLTGECFQLNWDVEMKIHQKEKYFGCTGRMHRDLIMNNNPKAIVFKMFFPIERPQRVKELPKIYDFVFFAGIAKHKGIEDLIDALVIVKKEKPAIKLNIIGQSAPLYMNFLFDKIKELGLSDNIIFDHYFPVHSDMHQHIVQAHIAVLPVKLDSIPGSVIEAILLDLPVVTYKTTGTPYLNKDGESVLIGNIGDIDMLAQNMLKLLDSPDYAQKIREHARAFVEREFSNNASASRLAKDYKAIIAHYHYQTPIPGELLFNTEEFPLY